ncbi:hypothetical protein D9M73_185160 [compost metagenome]
MIDNIGTGKGRNECNNNRFVANSAPDECCNRVEERTRAGIIIAGGNRNNDSQKR